MGKDPDEKPAQGEAPESAPPASRGVSELWLVAALVAWALGVITLLERTPYGLDEATARVVLILWSVSDKVPSAIVTLGVPDFRALFLAPAGLLFSGSLLAGKICTLFVYLAAVVGLHRWFARSGDSEVPMLASGLLLIAPLAVGLIDQLAVGPFLLLSLVLGAWADDIYRATRVRFGGWYFAQLLLCLALPTLHPAGLAYPVILGLAWIREPAPEASQAGIIPGRERTHVLLGVAIATLFGVLLAAGWPHQVWLENPLTALPRYLLDFEPQSTVGDSVSLLLGIVLWLALLAALWFSRARWRRDQLARSLVLAWAIAAFCGDASFALLSLVLLLHEGFGLLLRLRLERAAGFVGQRGVAFAVLTVISTSFLVADRGRYEALRRGTELSAQDELIRTLAGEVQQQVQRAAASAQPGLLTPEQRARSGPKVASQWPGRTMIACRCSTLPLPPPVDEPSRLAANLRGIDFVIFDPQDAANRSLARGFAELGGAEAETVSLQSGGVLLRLRPAEPNAPQQGPQPAPQEGGAGRG